MSKATTEVVFVDPILQIPNPEGSDLFHRSWLIVRLVPLRSCHCRLRLRAHHYLYYYYYPTQLFDLRQWVHRTSHTQFGFFFNSTSLCLCNIWGSHINGPFNSSGIPEFSTHTHKTSCIPKRCQTRAKKKNEN